ncbi:hypothetical protein F2Q69_00005445 [Brassica cretica]|uniref:Uncharacterized protein n=1 Tax=Brassica cretica TaxID=69181 RepID=A0A8S9PEN2_BRACR|nr:hypothetical protein F2Q69_00005445 [Brassica cretica]
MLPVVTRLLLGVILVSGSPEFRDWCLARLLLASYLCRSKESVLFQELMLSRTRLFAIHPLVVMVLWILSVSGWLAVEMRLYSLVWVLSFG